LFSSQDKGVPLDDLVRALDELPAPATEENWTGVSAPFDVWVSPGAFAERQAPKVKTRPATVAQKPRAAAGSTVEYHQTLVPAPQRRPNATMPLEEHERVGRLLKEVLAASRLRRGVYNRLNGVRSDLEEWMGREHRDISNDRFFDMYYHEGTLTLDRHPTQEVRNGLVARLAEAQQVLKQHYPDTAPLRSILSRIEAAKNSAAIWR